MKPKHMTVVYTINDAEAFEEERQRMMKLFQPSKDKPWAITAISVDDEIHRVDLLTEAVNNNDIEMADVVLGHLDIGNVKQLSDLCGC